LNFHGLSQTETTASAYRRAGADRHGESSIGERRRRVSLRIARHAGLKLNGEPEAHLTENVERLNTAFGLAKGKPMREMPSLARAGIVRGRSQHAEHRAGVKKGEQIDPNRSLLRN
jgi:hypothetical protein